MRRGVRYSLWGLATALVLLVLAIAWLGGSQGGLRFALGQVRGLLADRLEVGGIEGSLFGGMRLRDVRYYDPLVGDYRLALIEVAPRSRRLFSGELFLTAVTVEGVDITLAPPLDEAPVSEEPFRLPALHAPLAMRIEALQVREVAIRQHDGTAVVAISRLDGKARWTGTRLAVEQLDVQLPEGELGLTADIDTGADWAGDANLAFNLQRPDQPEPLAGTARIQGPQDTPTIHLALQQPSAATLDLDWPAGLASRWRLSLRSEAFELHRLLTDAPVRQLSLQVDGEGDLHSATLEGRVQLDDYGLALETLALRREAPRLVLERLAISEAGGSGRVEATGNVDLSGDTPVGQIDAEWSGINPPLQAPFDQLAASGRIAASGTPTQLQAHIEAVAQVNAQPVRLSLQAEGNPQDEVRIAPLTLVTGNGQLDGDARLMLADGVAWDATLRAQRFDPGLLLPDWPGRIDLDAQSKGHLPPGDRGTDALQASVDINRLGGQLRGRSLGGGGRIDLADGSSAQTDLDLRLGDNRLRIEGRVGTAMEARLRASLPDPAAFLPDAGGRIDADLAATGSWPALSIAGRVNGESVAYADTQIAELAVDLDARTDFSGDNRVRVQASGLRLAGQSIDALDLAAGGNEADNRMTLEAASEQGQLRIAVAGSYSRADSLWAGRIETLELASPQLPEPLALRGSSALRVSPDSAALEQACLHGADAHVCLDGDWDTASGGDVGFELARLPIAWLVALGGDETLAASGELGGRGRLLINADGTVTGQARIEGTPGRIAFVEAEAADEKQSELVAWTRLEGNVELAGDRRDVDATIELSPAGSLRILAATQANSEGLDTLSGHIDVDVPDLSMLALLTPELVNPAGGVRGQIQLGGTLDAPQAQGQIALAGFGAEIPAAGLRLRDSRVQVNAGADGRLTVDGEVRTSEDGALRIDGWIGPLAADRIPMEITLTGERVLAADIPAARVFVSPDLRIVNNARGLRVLGKVAIPQAMIRPELLEGGATAPSPDVHIADQEEVEVATAGLPVFANVEVTLGDRVRIEGYGLKGSLGGKLDIRERPESDTRALGEITVAGTYQAYGQDLDIERGRLLFSGPVGNPGLDIRAIRRIDAVTAGLQVTGYAQRPILEVYSVPVMDQAEALSYLVLGRPLRQATSSEDQSALGTAATAVSTAGGDLLAKSLGARLGLDEVGVGTSRELGAGALTVGKYLSPRLYLGYGRSLFDGGQLMTLRYRLTDHFELEAQSGTRDNKAGINYRLER